MVLEMVSSSFGASESRKKKFTSPAQGLVSRQGRGNKKPALKSQDPHEVGAEAKGRKRGAGKLAVSKILPCKHKGLSSIPESKGKSQHNDSLIIQVLGRWRQVNPPGSRPTQPKQSASYRPKRLSQQR